MRNKKCGNRSYRTEKRKLRLSPNKFQAIIRIFRRPYIFTFRNLRFYQILIVNMYAEKRYNSPFLKKDRNIPMIAYEICLACSLYHSF